MNARQAFYTLRRITRHRIYYLRKDLWHHQLMIIGLSILLGVEITSLQSAIPGTLFGLSFCLYSLIRTMNKTEEEVNKMTEDWQQYQRMKDQQKKIDNLLGRKE